MSREEVSTPGRVALKGWIAAKNERGSQADLAKRLGVTQQLVNQWLSGACRPGAMYRDALEVATGINPRDWETDEESEKRRRAMAGPGTEQPASSTPLPAFPPAGEKTGTEG